MRCIHLAVVYQSKEKATKHNGFALRLFMIKLCVILLCLIEVHPLAAYQVYLAQQGMEQEIQVEGNQTANAYIKIKLLTET